MSGFRFAGMGNAQRGTDMRADSKPTPLAEALQAYLKQAGLVRRIGQANVLEEWPALVGPQIAKVTRAESVGADNQLRVRVATAAWASELQLITPQILARVNRGRSGRITAIRWLAGGVGGEK